MIELYRVPRFRMAFKVYDRGPLGLRFTLYASGSPGLIGTLINGEVQGSQRWTVDGTLHNAKGRQSKVHD